VYHRKTEPQATSGNVACAIPLLIAFAGNRRQSVAVQKIFSVFKKYSGLTALFIGAASATGFAPLGLWPVTVIAFAVLMQLVSAASTKRGAFRIGWLFGVGHFCVGLNWIAGSFRYQEAMPVWLGWVAVVAVSLYVAVYPALAAMGAHWVGRGDKTTLPYPVAFILAFAGFWIITEWLRSWVFTGFAWNPLGAVLASGNFDWWLPTIGSYGGSGLFVLLSAIPLLFALRQWKSGILFLVSVGLIWLGSMKIYVTEPSRSQQPSITIVQPNIGQQDKYEPGYDALNFAKLAALSRPLPNQGPRLLLWPEAAIPDYLEDGYPYRFYQFQAGESATGARAQLTTLMGPKDVLMTGATRLVINKDDQMTAARNSVSAMDGGGHMLGYYDKGHLVPYGEYLALRWLLEPLGATRLVPGTVDFLPGPGARTLAIPGFGKVGVQICYEIIFSGHVVDRNDRPDFIFNPSNDAWFGSWGPPQHLAQARLRAIEEGLPVVRSTPTGISAVIDADGRIIQSLGLGTAGRIDAQLPIAHKPTLFARYGNILPLGFAALLIGLSLLPLAPLLPLARRSASR
jgi:apolipoprotein N-acyltransferase